MLKDKYTITRIENGTNGKTSALPQDRCITMSMKNEDDKKTGALSQIEITNISSSKIGTSSLIETANIPDFQILKIVSF